MIIILLLIITIILWLDFYIKHEKLIKKYFKKNTWEFRIDKKWVWDKIKEELAKEAKNFITKW